MSQLKIAIIGCGWLGLPLAKKLIKENFIVKGSTTSKEKISVLDYTVFHTQLFFGKAI